MAPPAGDAASGGLGPRIVSGLALATLALAYLGGVTFNLLLAAAVGIAPGLFGVLHPWRRSKLTRRGAFRASPTEWTMLVQRT